MAGHAFEDYIGLVVVAENKIELAALCNYIDTHKEIFIVKFVASRHVNGLEVVID